MKQETEVFNCDKCKNEFPSTKSLKKHLRRTHEVKNLALVESPINTHRSARKTVLMLLKSKLQLACTHN